MDRHLSGLKISPAMEISRSIIFNDYRRLHMITEHNYDYDYNYTKDYNQLRLQYVGKQNWKSTQTTLE